MTAAQGIVTKSFSLFFSSIWTNQAGHDRDVEGDDGPGWTVLFQDADGEVEGQKKRSNAIPREEASKLMYPGC